MRSRVKNLFTGGGLVWGNRGTIQIASWKCNFSIYLDIQAIITLLGLLLVLYVLVPSIDSFFYLTTVLLKSDIFQHSKAYSSQFSTYRHRTGFIVKRKQVRITNYIGIPINLQFFLQISKVSYLSLKKYADFKNSIKFIIPFFSQRYNWAYVYMY